MRNMERKVGHYSVISTIIKTKPWKYQHSKQPYIFLKYCLLKRFLELKSRDLFSGLDFVPNGRSLLWALKATTQKGWSS